MFSTSTSPSKWVTDPAFDAGTLVASPMAKMFGAHLGLQRVLVGGHEVEVVAEARRAADVLGAAVQRDHHGEVERAPRARRSRRGGRRRRRPRRC